VWEDYAEARRLCTEANVTDPTVLIVNDMISAFSEEAVIVTLHPEKLAGWLNQRVRNGHPPPRDVWCNRQRQLVNHTHPDRGGSGSLFAFDIAVTHYAADRVILCGAPMTVEGNHFVRREPWSACMLFRRAWIVQMPSILPFARSFSGWTREVLGAPTVDWIRS
jgi:hypothetical protein